MSELGRNIGRLQNAATIKMRSTTARRIARKGAKERSLAPRESSQAEILLAAGKILGIASKLGVAALRAAIDETSEARPIRRLLTLAPYSTEALTKV